MTFNSIQFNSKRNQTKSNFIENIDELTRLTSHNNNNNNNKQQQELIIFMIVVSLYLDFEIMMMLLEFKIKEEPPLP